MQRKRKRVKSSVALDKVYTLIGKSVVYAGLFCIFFTILKSCIYSFEPYVIQILNICISNSERIVISVSLFAVVLWGIGSFISIFEKRFRSKRSNSY